MKLIHVNGIPHWTDGFLTLPVMVGGQTGDSSGYVIPGASEDKPVSLIGQAVYGPDGRLYRIQSDAQGLWFVDSASPNRFERFQEGQYVTATGELVFSDANGTVQGETRKLSQTEFEDYRSGLGIGGSGALGTGGGSGSSGSYSSSQASQSQAEAFAASQAAADRAFQAEQDRKNREYQAPDPQAAINSMMDYYDRQVQAGLLPRETAMQQFEADLSAFNSNLDRAEAANRDIRERQIAESSRRAQLTSEATSRAGTVARDIIPRMTPGNVSSYNVPLLGNLQANPINVPELFNQGLPTLQDQWASGMIPATPAVDYGGPIAAPQLPQPVIPNLPDIQAMIDRLNMGSGSMG